MKEQLRKLGPKHALFAVVAIGLFLVLRGRGGGGGGGDGPLDPTGLLPEATGGAFPVDATPFEVEPDPEELSLEFDENGRPIFTYAGRNLRSVLADLGPLGFFNFMNVPATPPPAPAVEPPPPPPVAPVAPPSVAGASGQAPASANSLINAVVQAVNPVVATRLANQMASALGPSVTPAVAAPPPPASAIQVPYVVTPQGKLAGGAFRAQQLEGAF